MPRKNSKSSQNKASARSTAVQRSMNLVTKTQPFLIRRGRKLQSTPSHSESGLQMERTFRLWAAASGTTAAYTFQTIKNQVLAELGIATFADGSALRLCVKAISVYGVGPIVCNFKYANTDGSFNESVQFSDLSTAAAVSSVEVVYPLMAQITFDGSSTENLFQVTRPSAGNQIAADVRLKLSITHPIFVPPTFFTDHQPLIDDTQDRLGALSL